MNLSDITSSLLILLLFLLGRPSSKKLFMAAIKCCYLVSEHKASATPLCSSVYANFQQNPVQSMPPVYKCQHRYLAELCKSVGNIDGHRHLWSAACGQLDFPRVRLSTYRGRTFCYARPSAWNVFPDF